jgi:hypothetical protein
MLSLWALHHLAHIALPGLVVLATPVITLGFIIVGGVLWLVSRISDEYRPM